MNLPVASHEAVVTKSIETKFSTCDRMVRGDLLAKLDPVARYLWKTHHGSHISLRIPHASEAGIQGLYSSLLAVYDSVVTLAFAFVTLTPNCFAFAMISTLFLDDTECAILLST